jgi:hypothetical protein
VLDQNEALLQTVHHLRQQLAACTLKWSQQMQLEQDKYARDTKQLQWSLRKLIQENQHMQRLSEQLKEKQVMIMALEKQLEKWQARAASQQTGVMPENTTAVYQQSAHEALERSLELMRTQHEQAKLQWSQHIEQLDEECRSLKQEVTNHAETERQLRLQLDTTRDREHHLEEEYRSLRLRMEAEIKRWTDALAAQVQSSNQFKRDHFKLQQELEEARYTLSQTSLADAHADAQTSQGSGDTEMRRRLDMCQRELDMLRQENATLVQLLRDRPGSPHMTTSDITSTSGSHPAQSLQKQVEQLQTKMVELKSRYESQLKINGKIKKLIAQAASTGIPEPKGDILIEIPPGVQPMLEQASKDLSTEANSTPQFLYSNGAAAVKNHIQLIDLYNHALVAIAKLTAEKEALLSVKSSAEDSKAVAGDMSEDVVALREERDAWKNNTRKLERDVWNLQQQFDECRSMRETLEEEVSILRARHEPSRTSTAVQDEQTDMAPLHDLQQEVAPRSAPSIVDKPLESVSISADEPFPLRKESRLFEFGFCVDCKNNMMINI